VHACFICSSKLADTLHSPHPPRKPAPEGCGALWDSTRLKRVEFQQLSPPDFA
jgi:hypothetical protein